MRAFGSLEVKRKQRMLDEEDRDRRKILFREMRTSLGLSQGALAKWMYAKDSKLTRKYISRKETGENPVSTTDICFLRTLEVLSIVGVDLKSVEFHADLSIVRLVKK